MRGPTKYKKRKIPPDAKYSSTVLAKFINYIMQEGKKSVAEKIVYKSLDKSAQKLKKEPLIVSGSKFLEPDQLTEEFKIQKLELVDFANALFERRAPVWRQDNRRFLFRLPARKLAPEPLPAPRADFPTRKS